AHAGAVQGIGLILMDHAQCVGAVQFCQGAAKGAQQVGLLLVVVGQQVGDHFGVGFRGEGVAEFGQPFAQGAVVFNDAVVGDGQPLGEGWVAVTLGGFAMGGPAGVGDAQVALDGFCGQGDFQLYDLANGAGTLDALAGDQDSDSDRDVAAV